MSIEVEVLRNQLQNEFPSKKLQTDNVSVLILPNSLSLVTESPLHKLEPEPENSNIDINHILVEEGIHTQLSYKLKQLHENQQCDLKNRLNIIEREFREYLSCNHVNENAEIDSEEQILALLEAEEDYNALVKNVENYRLELFEINRIKAEKIDQERKNKDETQMRVEAEKLAEMKAAALASKKVITAAKSPFPCFTYQDLAFEIQHGYDRG